MINSEASNDKIDLIDIFTLMWRSKWTLILIMFVAFLIGIVFVNLKQTMFYVTAKIEYSEDTNFIDYLPLNEILSENNLDETYHINSENVFRLFISEFRDYQELVTVLNNNDLIKQSIRDLDEASQLKALINYAKSFELKVSYNKKKEPIYQIDFQWHNIEEGKELLDQALQNTLVNIKSTLLSDIDRLADAIEKKNKRNLENSKNDLKLILDRQSEENKSRIQFLSEQSAIAKELGIETNSLDANALSQTNVVNGVSLNISPEEVPFYLRGSKAIDKEISLIKNRSDEEQLLMAEGYLDVKESILILENNLSATQLRESLEYIQNSNEKNWVTYNLLLADARSNNRPILYLISSIIIGGIIGVIYILTFDILLKRKKQA